MLFVIELFCVTQSVTGLSLSKGQEKNMDCRDSTSSSLIIDFSDRSFECLDLKPKLNQPAASLANMT